MRYTSTHKSINSIVIPVMVLAGLGILMVYSSSVFISIAKYGDSFHYLWKHLINLGIGCAVLIFLSRLDYHVLRNLVWPLLILSLILLALVFVPGIGVSAGAKSEVKRWINLGFLTFQPSELVKISVVLFMSDYISRNAHRMKELRSGVVLPLAVIAVFQAIILFQPDFGSVMSIGILSLAMMFAGGIRWKHVFGIVGISFPIVCFLILSASYRLKRILCFIDPWREYQGCGYQLVQSFLAFGRGGITGVGIGDSKQKLFFLPEAHNDFIFSLIGEEIGFIGAVFILGIFLFLLIKLFQVAMAAEDSFGYFLSFGLTIMIISQALINFAVTIGLMPTKGLPLPLISYGGSALLVNMSAIGIMLNIAQNSSTPSRSHAFHHDKTSERRQGRFTEYSRRGKYT